MLPPSDLTPNKQEQFTPNGREPSEQLALGVNIGGIRIERDKSRKLKYLKKTADGCDAQFPFWLVIELFVSHPLGSEAPGADQSSPFCRYVIVFVLLSGSTFL